MRGIDYSLNGELDGIPPPRGSIETHFSTIRKRIEFAIQFLRSGDAISVLSFPDERNYPFFVYNTPSITITLIDETRARYRDTPRIQRINASRPTCFSLHLSPSSSSLIFSIG